tara:strand:+ start:153 stop:368 length:216 start_codon:yes stop_codon:yes gene_type:complete
VATKGKSWHKHFQKEGQEEEVIPAIVHIYVHIYAPHHTTSRERRDASRGQPRKPSARVAAGASHSNPTIKP